ncbi:hypothetical protein [Actinoalloteichus sp. GBA129-24]|uniref:hypothetical protein n=1 Tax=Actinoalloteichus sp. GBA129-24 TaxID=1612551 RepID=UPI0009503B4A|nr:hypothetical protein [Actinoalloteichus sp. GBA129-24]APU22358.1 hypothetical protein UA75_21845 [Actinoalloteichus sp. GBA129-24]
MRRGVRRHTRRDRLHADRWDTVRPERRVLAITRNVTTVDRLLDVLPLLSADRRIEISFTVNHGSAFEPGLHEFLNDIGAKLRPWSEAVREDFHLAVAANVNAGMRGLRCPLIVLPHGVGYNRVVPSATGDHVSPTGLSRRELMHRRRLIPSVIGLSHPEQLDRLARSCPPALAAARVIGDPAHDRMIASLPRRDRYRQALGLTTGQRLVVISSTWHDQSLFGTWPDLPDRLTAALPMDEYRVALVLHPNIWSKHSPFLVRSWLRNAMDAGLLVIPPTDGWRAALIAADWVIGDHGSVSVYGAALGRPALLAATGEGEIAPGAPTATLGRGLPRLDPAGDLLGQLQELASRHRATEQHALTETVLTAPGSAHAALRSTFYELLGLSEPAHAARCPPIGLPQPEAGEPPTAFLVDATAPDASGVVTMHRYPALLDAEQPGGPVDPMLVVEDDEADPRLHQSADLVVSRSPVPTDEADERAAELAGRHPGARAVAVTVADGGGCLIRSDDGRTALVHDRSSPGGVLDPVLTAAGWIAACSAATDPPAEWGIRLGTRVRLLATGSPPRTLSPGSAVDGPPDTPPPESAADPLDGLAVPPSS